MRARAFAGGLAVLATAAVYFVLTGAKGHPLWYIPLEHRWTWDLPARAVGIDWYYRAGLALAAGALAYPAGLAIAARSPRAARPATVKLVFGLGFGLMLWAALYTSFALSTTPRQRHRDDRGHADHDHED